MLRDLLDKGKCALGYHVEAWQYADSGTCRQTSRCVRCDAVSERTAHAWSGWRRLEEDSCTATRTCLRCGQHETQDDHDWSMWTYEDPDSCRLRVRCSRCTTPGSSTRLEHTRGEWQWSDFYATGVAVCRRCGEMVFATEDGEEEPVTFQDADAAIMHVVGSSTVEEARTRIAARQAVLLSPVAAHVLRFAADQRASDEAERQTFVDLGRVLTRCRDEGIDAVLSRPDTSSASPLATGPASAPPSAYGAPADAARVELDPSFVGHWRHTEAMSSGGFSLVTDTHMVLDTSGRFAWWSHSASGAMGESHSAREHGTWRVSGGVLSLVFDDGTTQTLRCQVEGDAMLLPDESRCRLWKRVG
jgi:hypothetical protein